MLHLEHVYLAYLIFLKRRYIAPTEPEHLFSQAKSTEYKTPLEIISLFKLEFGT